MKLRSIFLFFLIINALSYGYSSTQDSVYAKHFISTSLWSAANLFPDPADFYELNYGYRLSPKDAIVANATTWKYWEPLGIPLTSDKKYKHIEDYPGYVRAYGVGIVYQRFVWHKFYSAVHANAFVQNFYGTDNAKIQAGFQLYLQYRMGYRIEMLKRRFFLEPSLSFNYWPINTGFPSEFDRREDLWPNYFLFEPHVNFGVNF